MRWALLLILFACSSSGSVVVGKSEVSAAEDTGLDDEDNSQPEQEPSEDTADPVDPPLLELQQSWSGERSIHFIDVCSVELIENGIQITEENNPSDLLGFVEGLCNDCLVFQLDVLAETTFCEGIGDIPATGIRFRAIDKNAFRLWAISLREDPQNPEQMYWRPIEVGQLELSDGDPAVAESVTTWAYSYSDVFQGQLYEVLGTIQLTPEIE